MNRELRQPDRLRVTVSDVVTGEVLGEQVIYDDYCLVTAGSCYLDSQAIHANGTHQLVVKGGRGARDAHLTEGTGGV